MRRELNSFIGFGNNNIALGGNRHNMVLFDA